MKEGECWSEDKICVLWVRENDRKMPEQCWLGLESRETQELTEFRNFPSQTLGVSRVYPKENFSTSRKSLQMAGPENV